MKKKWVPLVLFILVTGLMCNVSCSNMAMLLSSGNGVVNQIKEDALDRERLMEEHMFIHEAVMFDFNEAKLSSKAKILLNRKAAWLIRYPNINVLIEGHCDSLGSDAYNLVLAEKRGQAVKDFMINMGINESRMTLVSLGERDPVDCGKTEEELVKNRRVTFRFAS